VDAVVFITCDAVQGALPRSASYANIQQMYGSTLVQAHNPTLVRFNLTSACACNVRYVLGYLAAVSSAVSIQSSPAVQTQAMAAARASLNHAFANKSLANSTCSSVSSGLGGTSFLLEWTNFCSSGACPSAAGITPVVAAGEVDRQWLGFIVMGAIIVCMTTALWVCIWKKQKREDELDKLRKGGEYDDALVPHRHSRSSISNMLGAVPPPPRTGVGSTGLSRAASLSKLPVPISGSDRRLVFGKDAGAEGIPNYDNPLHAAKGPMTQQQALRYGSNVAGNRRSTKLSRNLSASNILSPLQTAQKMGFPPEHTEAGTSPTSEAPRPLSSRLPSSAVVSPSRETVRSLSSAPAYGSARRMVPSVGRPSNTTTGEGDSTKFQAPPDAVEPRPKSIDKRLKRDKERSRTQRGRTMPPSADAEDKPWVIPVGVGEVQQEIVKKETVQLRRVIDVRGDQSFTQLRRAQSTRGGEMAKTLQREDSSYAFTAVVGRATTAQSTGKSPRMLSSRFSK
jgi:hypothetical protein